MDTPVRVALERHSSLPFDFAQENDGRFAYVILTPRDAQGLLICLFQMPEGYVSISALNPPPNAALMGGVLLY